MLPLGDIGGTDCEQLGDGLLVQPVNAITSLAYVVAGVWLVWRTWRGPHRWSAMLYGAMLVATGLGSVAYHGPQPTGAQLMHDAPIAILGVYAAVVVAVRALRRQPLLPGSTPRRWAVALTILAAAILVYRLGRTDSAVCDPDSLVQLHGAWHFASSVALVIGGLILFRPPDPRTLPLSPAPPR